MEPDAAKQITEILEYFMPLRELASIEEMSWRVVWLLFRDALIFGALGWIVAWTWERRGLRILAEREADVADIRVDADDRAVRDTAVRDGAAGALDTRLLDGSIVLSHDYFRGIMIFIARIFGGRIRHYERLYDRARREALVRLKETARGEGYDHVINLKLLPAAIKRNGPATVEVLAYGTGIRLRR